MSTFPSCEPTSHGRLSTSEFQWISRTVHEHAGIDLSGKQTLVEARIGKQLRELQCGSFKEFHQLVEKDTTGSALTRMVDALTTNHTTFFREPQHFEFLRKRVLPEFKHEATFRVWSSACSSGEEPYSIAFTLMDELGEAARSRVNILATDISTKVLQAAQKAVYPAAKFQPMPMDQMRRHLLKGVGPAADSYLVKPATRSLVRFEHLNLMEDFSSVGVFSVIFCRNVMIYFNKPTQEQLVNRLSARLCPGGYLFIGHAESLSGIQHSLEYIQPAVYRNPGGARVRGVRS